MNALSPDAADDPAAVAAQAGALLDRRRTDQARALLAPALARHPDDTGLLYESARADYLEDANGRARDTLAHVLRLAPGDVNARWLLFLAQMDDGQLADAELLVIELLREHPQHAPFYAGYCRLMLRALDFEKARALVDEALRHAPDDDACLRARTLCDLIDGRGDSAALGRLVAQDPSDVYTLRLVVSALSQRGRLRQAHRLAQELLRSQPGDAQLLELVQTLATATHWSMVPLWPMQRWGWTASIALWVGAIALLQLMRRVAPEQTGVVSVVVLGYVAYSWIWPPLLRRWIRRA
jgi:tetratricopeptide (TPR) repeat protein